MPANLGTESTTVQHPLARYTAQAGWTIVSKEDATTLRRAESGMFSHGPLKIQSTTARCLAHSSTHP